MSDKKQKVGIMGGTFNPIHMGHLMIAQTALSQFGLDFVYFMPNGIPEYKSRADIVNGSHRLEMVRLAIENNDRFILSDFELKRAGFTYTYETLMLLNEKYPCNEYYFIMGADSLFSFTEWKCPEEIAKSCILLCAARDGLSKDKITARAEFLKERYGTEIFFLECPNIDISSRLIREKIQKKQSVRYFVPEKVYNYINEHNVYESLI